MTVIFCSLSQPASPWHASRTLAGENCSVGFRLPFVSVLAKGLPSWRAPPPGDLQEVAHCRVNVLRQLLWKTDQQAVSKEERNVRLSDGFAKRWARCVSQQPLDPIQAVCSLEPVERALSSEVFRRLDGSGPAEAAFALPSWNARRISNRVHQREPAAAQFLPQSRARVPSCEVQPPVNSRWAQPTVQCKERSILHRRLRPQLELGTNVRLHLLPPVLRQGLSPDSSLPQPLQQSLSCRTPARPRPRRLAHTVSGR